MTSIAMAKPTEARRLIATDSGHAGPVATSASGSSTGDVTRISFSRAPTEHAAD
jgi:hypothetical protein